ncbi:MAG: MBL fold metallo-hydrolase [Pseudomonadota bacterium]
MNVTFYGAVREVTGSMHLVSSDRDRIILDCGMFQGRRRDSYQKNLVIPFDPRMIANIILSHAHIDHSGRIPIFTRNGFSGRIICTRATSDACKYLLLDSARIQEADANYLNYKTLRSFLIQTKEYGEGGRPKAKRDKVKKLLKKGGEQVDIKVIADLMERYRLEQVRPLYTIEEAQNAIPQFEGYPYGRSIPIGKGMSCVFYEAGHILGSSMIVIKFLENGRSCTIGYTGDIGRFGKPILKDPATHFSEEDSVLDLLIMESTYGDRLHEPVGNLKLRLKEIVNETVERGGSLLIPSFAFGRTQELLYMFHILYRTREVPLIPIYVDSPLAIELTRVYAEHPEVYDRESHEDFLKKGENPFQFKQLRLISSVEESMQLMREKNPHIVISGSGMCEGGRILHHLRYKIHNPKNTILMVGYMAENTLGRRILEQGTAYKRGGKSGEAPLVKFLNKIYPLKAEVVGLQGFSAHADKDEMIRFLKMSNLRVRQVAVVHGEEDQSLPFASTLEKEGYPAFVPRMGETVAVSSRELGS